MTSGAAPIGRQARTALIAVVVALAMLALGFASVPLYRMFCAATGFGGTTRRATEAELAGIAAGDRTRGAGRTLSIRFDSNVNGLGWDFYPEQRTQEAVVGQKRMAIFIARNTTDRTITGRATYNVTPEQAGFYFNKIQCFCFTEQTLKPGQTVRMPVLYYIDPKILDDADDKDVQEITLSYTFYPVERDGKRS